MAMTIPNHIDAFWTTFLNSDACPANASDLFLESFQIGSTAQAAHGGARLVLSGAKTATSSLLWQYELSGEPVPFAGSLSVLEDGRRSPVCVVRTTWVDTIPYGQLDEAFARDYGETHDGRLQSWYEAFGDSYAKLCQSMGRELTADTPLVCERFEVIYRS